MKIIFKIEDIPNPGDKDLYHGIKEINKNNYQGALSHFEKSSDCQNEYGMLFNAIFQFTGLGLAARDPRKAMDIFKKTAYIYNNPVALHFVGAMYLEGDDGVPTKEKAGIHWLTLAANEGWKYSMGVLGIVYLFVQDKKDPKKALEWFKKVATVDIYGTRPIEDEPYYLFGNKKFKLYLNDESSEEVKAIHQANRENIISLNTWVSLFDSLFPSYTKDMLNLAIWDILTDRKSIIISACQYYISVIYFIGVNRFHMDIRRSIYWTRKAIKSGNSEANKQLATFYEFGLGVEKNYAEALKYYKESRCPEAVFRVGIFYFEGKGTDRDHKVALSCFKVVISLEENGQSCFFMGRIYKDGKDGVQQDYLKSVDCFTMAFLLGVPEAATEIGIFYRNGLGVQKDNQKAYSWFSKGAMMGCPKSFYALGLILFNDDSENVDYEKAFTYFMLSSLGGFEPAIHMLRQVSDFIDL